MRLHGLQAKPELNGKEGTCLERKADTGRWLVRLEGGSGEFAFKEANLQLLLAGASCPDGGGVVEGLDELLAQANCSRASVCQIMVYCLDNAQECEHLVKRLLSVPRSVTSASQRLARLFAVSDILHNSAMAPTAPASAFRRLLQEQLPETFEKLGRLWLHKLEPGTAAGAVQATLRQLLQVWAEWLIFPPHFTRGLTCLLFSPVPEISAKEAKAELDEVLQEKLLRWFSGLNQGSLPYECQMRGLAGPRQVASICRARLCHFERFWHLQEGMAVRLRALQSAPQLNGMLGLLELWDAAAGRWKVRLQGGEVKSVKPENLAAELGSNGSGHGSSHKEPANDADVVEYQARAARAESEMIDGTPVTAAELDLAKKDAAKERPRCQLPLMKRQRR